jgi:hypothetical protein
MCARACEFVRARRVGVGLWVSTRGSTHTDLKQAAWSREIQREIWAGKSVDVGVGYLPVLWGKTAPVCVDQGVHRSLGPPASSGMLAENGQGMLAENGLFQGMLENENGLFPAWASRRLGGPDHTAAPQITRRPPLITPWLRTVR